MRSLIFRTFGGIIQRWDEAITDKINTPKELKVLNFRAGKEFVNHVTVEEQYSRHEHLFQLLF